jgi:HD-GYP domain-containing protein (c-di-GMP phosphodiesterase class II)
MIQHCGEGQNNISWLPLLSEICGIILYHHERETGDGPFKKLPGEFPLEAALIAAADSVDLKYNLGNISPDALTDLHEKIRENADTHSTREAVDALLDVLDIDMLESLRDENISNTLDEMLPEWKVNVWESDVLDFANFFAHVIDSRGHFAGSHSAQIADRAWIMANHYCYRPEERSSLYLAAALHDLGKMAVPAFSSEEPHLISEEELFAIKNHSQITYEWLSTIPDFELITSWAANHHEKLDGSGYPKGKHGNELDFNSRLIACLCIYQSISEKCPHHGARNHEETMSIMFNMAENGLIDEKITQDIDDFMEVYSLREVPSPGAWQ